MGRARLRRQWLHLLSQRAGARRIRGGRYRPKMGRSPQRAARLHFRTTCFPGEDAHGPGPCQHRRTRTKGRGKPFAHRRRKSCAIRSGGLLGCRSLGEGDQSAARNFSFARNVTWCYCIETANQPRSGESSTFKVSCNSSGWEHKPSCNCITACGRTTVARADGGLATNVFRCLASRASLFAAQHQL